jgi:hypothetical protein
MLPNAAKTSTARLHDIVVVKMEMSVVWCWWWVKEVEVVASCHVHHLTGEACLLYALRIVKLNYEFVVMFLSAFHTSEKMTSTVS